MIGLKITKTTKRLLAYGLSLSLIMSFSADRVSAQNAEQKGTTYANILMENTYNDSLSIKAEAVSGSSISQNTSGSAISGSTSGSAIMPPTNTDITQDNSTSTPAPDYGTNNTSTPTPDSTNTPIPDNGASSTNTPAPDNTITTSPNNPSTPAAIGTMLTVGKYIYKVTSKDTVTLKGFANGVSKSSVIVKNKITHNNIVYNVTKVGNAAFHNKTAIKTVIVRKAVTDIGKNAFNGCKNMTKITIRGAKIIRKKAFLGCAKLKTVNITSTNLATVKSTAFKNIKKNATINVMNNSAKTLVKAVVPATVKVNKM